MKIYRKIFHYFLIVILLNISTSFVSAKNIPSSFADLAEELMPSVVNISSTQTVKTTTNPFPFQFPPGSPFEDMFKEFSQPEERKATSLGSGFVIDKKGIVVTNNHVIQGAEDIIVRVNGAKEYKAKVIGADPYADLAKLAPYAVNAQVKVKIPVNGKKVDTDLGRIVKILNDAQYAGYMVLEYEEKEDPFVQIPKYKKMLEALL